MASHASEGRAPTLQPPESPRLAGLVPGRKQAMAVPLASHTKPLGQGIDALHTVVQMLTHTPLRHAS